MNNRDLITSSGQIIPYKSLPLYSGSSVINPENSRDNLIEFKSVMERHNVFFALTAGTVLGAVRDKDFIKHDEDIDLALYSQDKQRVIDLLPELINRGFRVVRYNRRHVISIMRNGDYIDLCFFEKLNNEEYDCDGCMLLAEFMENTISFPFLGTHFFIPKNYEGYLTCEYGINWRTPRYDFDFNMPKWKTICKITKEGIKNYLPDFLFFYLSKISANKQHQKYRNLFANYLEEAKNKQ